MRSSLFDEMGQLRGEWVEAGVRENATVCLEGSEILARFGLQPPFQGNFLVEVAHPNLLPWMPVRGNCDYYAPGRFITTVHDQDWLREYAGHNYTTHVYTREDAEHESELVIQNPYDASHTGHHLDNAVRVTLVNSHGESRVAPWVGGIRPYGVRRIPIRTLFPDAIAFLGGQPGSIRLETSQESRRPICLTFNRVTGRYSINHATDDARAMLFEAVPPRVQRSLGWGTTLPAMAVERVDLHTRFLICNNVIPVGRLTLEARLYDADGQLVCHMQHVPTLRPLEHRTIELKDLLNGAGVCGDFVGHLALNVAGDYSILGLFPYKLDINTEFYNDAGMSHIDHGSEFLNVEPVKGFGSRPRTFIWSRAYVTDEYETFFGINNTSSRPDFDKESRPTIQLWNGSGDRYLEFRPVIKPFGAAFYSVEEAFHGAGEFLAPSQGAGHVTIDDRQVRITGFHWLRQRSSGTWAADHLFGG